MIQALSPDTSQKAFTNGIGSWRVIRCFQDLDAARCSNSSETRPKLAIVIANKILRRVSIWSCLSQLLCGPLVSRRPCHTNVDHSARFEFDDEERKERAKEQVGHLQEIAGPYVFCVIAQERRPILSSWSRDANVPMYFWMVRLHTRISSLSNSPRMRSAPQSRLFFAISLIKIMSSGARFGLGEVLFDLRFQNQWNPTRCQCKSVSG
jgi:hypothetical protein